MSLFVALSGRITALKYEHLSFSSWLYLLSRRMRFISDALRLPSIIMPSDVTMPKLI